MTEVIMPKMGDGMEEGTLLDWLKGDGDKVKSGEVIGNIQTDKATLELEAPGSGILSGILINPGATVPVGKPMAVILKEGESLPGNWGGDGPANPPATVEPAKPAEAPKAAETPSPAQPIASHTTPSAPPPKSGDRIAASPLAQKIASELGVDLSGIAGSGPGGRIVERDVRGATSGSRLTKPAPSPALSGEKQTVQLTKLRQITAQRTTQSKQQVPHYYVSVEVDVERLMHLRATFEEEEAGKLSLNDFIVRASALALVEMPVVNATFEGSAVVQYGDVNIGIAAAVEDGLTVAVIKGVQNLTLRQIGEQSRSLVAKARESGIL